MINFHYYARSRRRRRRAPDRRRSRRQVHRRRHQPRRPDEGGCRAPARLIDIIAAPAHQGRGDAGRRAAHRRAGAELRPRLSPADRATLSAARERDPRRRVGAAAQHGDDRRQSAAAHPLRLLLRHRDALQQARARQRLPGHRRPQPQPRHPRHQRSLHRHPPLRHVRRARRARRHRPRRRTGRRRAPSRSPISIACPATRRSATPISHRTSSSPRSSCRTEALPSTTPT